MIGMVYDATGNLTDAGGGWTFTYDATGQQAASAMGNVQMSYDGDRLRCKKSENTLTTYYLRSSVLGGQVVAELTSGGVFSRGYVYLGGQILAVQQSGVYWMHQDPVAKSKRITDTLGNVVSTIELDPWGGETNRSSNEAFQPRKFATYQRDSIGSDDAMHRRYNRWWARFEQPDPYSGSYALSDPQSFNRYSYVQNDPVNIVDPNGLLPNNLWPPCTPGNSSAFCGIAGFGGWGSGFNMNDQQSILNPSGRQIIRDRTFTLSFHDEDNDIVYFWTWIPMIELITSRQPYTTADMLRELMGPRGRGGANDGAVQPKPPANPNRIKIAGPCDNSTYLSIGGGAGAYLMGGSVSLLVNPTGFYLQLGGGTAFTPQGAPHGALRSPIWRGARRLGGSYNIRVADGGLSQGWGTQVDFGMYSRYYGTQGGVSKEYGFGIPQFAQQGTYTFRIYNPSGCP